MKTISTKKPVALALGTVFAASMLASSVAMAGVSNSANPFSMTEMSSGYMQISAADKKNMEGKCGDSMNMKGTKAKDGKCGDSMNMKDQKGGKKVEGKCGEGKCGDAKAMKEGKCGGKKEKKKMEGKCGEGKCGGSKNKK